MDQKRALRAADLQLFVKEYARKAQKGADPNDRDYNREVEKKLKKHLKPDELDKLLRGDDNE
ncbi:MAG: hypothetical protein IT560_09835 [Alphaproteobacteria bacterium]|nr:hypothetical protein [Alphaproteobacteria bacterium]